jgi:acetyl esterase/lipase
MHRLTLAPCAALACLGMTAPEAGAQAAAPYKMTAVDTAHGDREFHLLWPDGAPGAVGNEAVDRPKITVYRAPAEKATGTAVVVCPGGGYVVLAADHEGKQVAEWLNSLGVSAFVLQYRLGPRYHHPAPLQDAQRALRMVRTRAAEWGVDPTRIGILGFSAGGHLASTAATHFDDGDAEAADPIERASSRPDFAVLCYPVITLAGPYAHAGSRTALLGESPDPALVEALSNERQVTQRTPPTFLFHTADDASVPVENSLMFFSALRKAGVPAELHVFAHGRHGVGLAPDDPSLSQWPGLCAQWMRGRGLLTR